ncbi:helix-turn-helix domain-containing protein [Lactiplantibacillus plantarum]|uniref:helix-turn-helix domain-containing protein n=1 Tax=Lactiplantibacillus plantarum TaxID=1590 RepID=UPI003F52F063
MFPDRLKLLRQENGWTQKDLAERINVSAKTIGAWERATREPPMDTIRDFASIFSVSTDYLLGISNSRNGTNNKIDLKEQIEDKNKIMTYQGRPIPEEDLKYIKRLLDGSKDDDD